MSNFIILIAEDVIGKSRGPKEFKRFKPVLYSTAHVKHKILYAKEINGNPEEHFHQIEGEMSIIQSKNTDVYNVVQYTISVLDVNNNKVIFGSESIFGLDITNTLLIAWGVINVEAMPKIQRLTFLCKYGNRQDVERARTLIRALI